VWADSCLPPDTDIMNVSHSAVLTISTKGTVLRHMFICKKKKTAFISQKVVTIIWESKRFIVKCGNNLNKVCLEDVILLGYDTVLWGNGNLRIQLPCDAVSYLSRILCYDAVRNSKLTKYFFQSEKCVSFGTLLVFTNIFF